MKKFMDFIREQGVVGLAIGFILGGAVSGVVKAFVEDIINPIMGLALGFADSLETAVLKVGAAEIMYGHFLSVLIDFVVIALVVFYIFKGMGFEKLDKKKK
jgi:large conductance mechanosensitive channel